MKNSKRMPTWFLSAAILASSVSFSAYAEKDTEDFGNINDISVTSNEITIPGSIISIEKEAFHNCRGLKKITIPEGVKSVGSRHSMDASV